MNSKSDTIDEILEQLDEDYDRNNYHAGLRTAKAKLQALLLRERIDELNRYEKTEVKFGIHQSEDMYNGIALSYNVYRKKRKKQLQSELSRLSGEESHE